MKVFQPAIVVLGVVHPYETVPITTPAPGTISFPPRFPSGLQTGETVAAGEVVAMIQNETSRSTLAEARLQSEASNAELDRAQRGFESGISAGAELSRAKVAAQLARERLTSAQRQTKKLALRAPRKGRLVVRNPIAPATEVAAGTELAQLAVGGSPRIVGYVAASELVRLRLGQQVRITTGGEEPVEATGKLAEVASIVDENGTVKIIASIDASSPAPLAGQGVEMRIILDSLPGVITVPEEALVIDAGGTAVFIIQARPGFTGTMRVKRVPVRTAARGDGRVEIRSGISNGDRIVVSGASFLTDGAFVTEAPAGPEKESGGGGAGAA